MRSRVLLIAVAVTASVALLSTVAWAGSSGSATTGQSAWPPQAGWPAGKPACPVKGKYTVGFTQPLPDPNYALITSIVAGDLKKMKIGFTKAVANLNPGKQIADIDSMVQQGVKTLIVAPVDPNAVQPALQRAREKGVKIVVTDVFVGGPYATNIATSPYDAGYQGAQRLAKLVGNGRVAAIEGPSFAGPVLTERNRGFGNGAGATKLDVVSSQTNFKITPDGARDIVEAWRLKYGSSLKGIWAFNDLSALGAASALSGDFQPKVVGLNGEPAAIDAIKAGKMAATFDLQPAVIAHSLAWAADSARCNKTMAKTIFVGVKLYTAANAKSWVPWAQLPQQPFKMATKTVNGKVFVQPKK
ncbi:MAG: sugar ABC transporter substrate-binding protein [Actinobacteria bacterium]|nr:sugar ABC transporter substrate-binding protein [Actinomycetota bacterium]